MRWKQGSTVICGSRCLDCLHTNPKVWAVVDSSSRENSKQILNSLSVVCDCASLLTSSFLLLALDNYGNVGCDAMLS